MRIEMNRINTTIIIALITCLVIAIFSGDLFPSNTKTTEEQRNYNDSVQVVNDAVKDSNSSHIPQ